MPKAAPGSRVSASLRSADAEGIGEGGFEEGKTEGGAALEAVTELDGKFEGWHLQAKQDVADAKAESAAGQAAVQKEIAALTALVCTSQYSRVPATPIVIAGLPQMISLATTSTQTHMIRPVRPSEA